GDDIAAFRRAGEAARARPRPGGQPAQLARHGRAPQPRDAPRRRRRAHGRRGDRTPRGGGARRLPGGVHPFRRLREEGSGTRWRAWQRPYPSHGPATLTSCGGGSPFGESPIGETEVAVPGEQQNPFRIGERVSGYAFADREQEVARIRQAMLSASSLLVYGQRRMGKSSTIHVAAEAARRSRPKPIIVSADVATATNLFDVSARLLRSLYLETRWLKLRLEDLLGGLAPRVTVKLDEHGGPPSITFGIDRRTASEEERRRAFEG